MGKSKGSQRTKGNVRPSSSGRAAELLDSSGKLGFIGFGASKIGQHVTQDLENDVDGMFSMVMKKMLKRDATTRLKAIQEFRDLICEKDRDVVLSVLPFWPRLFNKLSLDFDRRVREATQEANAKLIEQVKRDIAPYLRNIMGVWLLSQCDIYAPAASLAQSTFHATFPEEKRSEALVFCKDQILTYFKNNLFEQTPQSLSEPNVPAEEIENKYVLVIAGSLQGLKLFLTTISTHEKDAVSESIKKFVSENKFWKHVKNKNPQVRVAWYNLVSVLCHDMPGVFEKFEHKLGCAVLGCLSESDPAVASAVWEAALHYVVSFQNCWESIDIHKVVLPQLWTLLKDGGKGNAALLFPCLLPFLSKLPSEVIEQKPQFFFDFFGSIIESLFLDNVKKSTIECNAIISAYMECLQYVCLQNKDKDILVEKLICEQLLSLVTRSFTIEGAHLPVSKFYQLLGLFIQSLEQNQAKENTHESDKLQKVIQVFWEKMYEVCCNLLKSEHLVQHADLVFLAYFFHCMYEPSNVINKKKKAKVRFVEENAPELDERVEELQCTSTPVSYGKRTSVFEFTVKLCHVLCSMLEDNFTPHYMKLLCEIITASRSPELFYAILLKLDLGVDSSKDAPVIFFKTKVLNWIQKDNLEKTMIENLVDIIFVICSCVEKESATHMLNLSCEIENPLFLKGLLQRGLTMVDDDKLLCKWLKSHEVGLTVVSLLKLVADVLVPSSSNSIVLSNLNSFCSTLKTFFTSSILSESKIDTEDVLSVIKTTFEQYLVLQETSESQTDVLIFMCDICKQNSEHIKGYWNLPIIKDLMTVLFNCSIIHTSTSHENLRSMILMLWLDSIKHLPQWQLDFYNHKGFVFDAATKLHELIISPESVKNSASLVEIVQFLFWEVEKILKSNELTHHVVISNFLSNFLVQVFPSKEEWSELKSGLKLNILPAYMEKKLFYPFPEDITISGATKFIPAYVQVAQLVSEITVHILSYENATKSASCIREHLMKQLPQLAWAFSFCEGCGYLKKEDTDEFTCASKLQKNCFRTFALATKEEVFEFLKDLHFMCRVSFFEWEIPFQSTLEIVQTFYPKEIPDLLNDFLLAEEDSFGKYLVRQTIIHHVTNNIKLELINKFLQSSTSVYNSQSAGIFSELCCCLQDLVPSSDVQTLIKDVLQRAVSAENSCTTSQNRFIFSSDSEQDSAGGVSRLDLSNVATREPTLLMALLGCAIRNIPDILSSLWSDVFDYIDRALEHCLEITENVCSDAKDLIFAHRTCSVVCIMLSTFSEESERSNFTNQQKTRFQQISENLLLLFYRLADTCDKMVPLPKVVENLLTTVSQAIEFLPSESLLAAVLESIGAIISNNESDGQITENEEIQFPLKNFTRFLTSSLRPLQLGSHTVLMKTMCLLPSLLDSEDEKSESDENEEINKRLLPLVELLDFTSQIVESMLSEVKIGECCLIIPNTDSYTYTLGYLFAWTEFLEFLAACSVQERSTYVEYLEKANLFKSLLLNLFRLMPEKPTSCYKNVDKDNMSQQDVLKVVFAEPPVISLLDPPAVEDIQYVACNTYYNTLKKLPAVVRMWWNNLDKRSAEAVNKFTSKNVSALLASKEIQAVHDSDMQFPNMTIRARYGTREVMATYTVDGLTVELSIQLPVNYPLGPIVINDSGKVRISKPESRQWLMQLTAFLTYQNGSMLDGLLLWKKNLDKKFEGVEECMICFYILHSTTAKLPQRSCRTCRKKFHTDCIYKWFITSNNSTCPLCRCYF